MLFCQRVFEQVAQQLHRHVLERQRRPVGEFEYMHARLQRAQRRDLREIGITAAIAVNISRVGLGDDGLEVSRRNVGNEFRQHREREIGVRQLAPRIQFRPGHLRILLRQVQPAIGCETAKQDFGKIFRGRIAACGDVFHLKHYLISSLSRQRARGACYLPNSSSLILVTLPATTPNASIFLIAALMRFSRVRWVSMIRSAWSSPSPGSFWITASIEICSSARMRVMSASTPGLSCTRILACLLYTSDAADD